MEKEKELNQERVEQILSDLNGVWIKGGYVTELEYEQHVFSSPFDMEESIKNSSDEESKKAFHIFRSELLRTQMGQRYVKDLWTVAPYRVGTILRENAQDSFWDIEDAKETSKYLRNIAQMSPKAEREEGQNLSTLFVQSLMSNYLFRERESHVGPRNRYEELLLENRKYLVYKYFEDYGVTDLEYWSSEEGVRTLYQYTKIAGSDVVDYLRAHFDTYNMLKGEKSEKYKERMENLEAMWSLLELPGLAEGKYEELRDSFISKLKSPNIAERYYQVFGKGRKNPYINMLNRIHKFSKDDESIYQEVSKKFMSNLLFDPELFVLVEGLRRISKEEEERKIFRKYSVEITFNDVFKASIENPEYRSLKWFKEGGFELLQDMYTYSPALYMMVVDTYVDMYCNEEEISKREMVALREILTLLFSADMKSLTYNGYQKAKNERARLEGGKVEGYIGGFVTIIWGKEYEEKRLEENKEFFEDTQEWSNYWKGAKHIKNFGRLFQKNEKLFDTVIEGLMQNTSNTKSANFFDNVRMINRLGRKLAEEAARSAHIEEDRLGDVRDETERLILKNAFEACSVPEMRVSIKGRKGDIETVRNILSTYLNLYGEIVERLPEGMVMPGIYINEEGFIAFKKEVPKEAIESIRALGFEIVNEDGFMHIKGTQDQVLNRLLGILITPTLYEWREDDKENKNLNNDRVRTLFFVPDKLEIEFQEDKEDLSNIFLSKSQRAHFIQNYLQWYIKSKYLSGNIMSLNTVVSTWLADDSQLRRDIDMQKSDIRGHLDGIWSDFTDALALTYGRERFRRDKILQRFLLATNIQELVPLITNDVTQVATLASAILCATLEAAQEARVGKDLMRVSSTLSNQFKGSLSIEYLGAEKYENVKKALTKLGFEESEIGLTMFRNIYKNLWYLRGTRGSNQTLTISTEGLSISNPSQTMYASEEKESKDSKGVVTKQMIRKFGGGRDKVSVSWSQIRSVGEVYYDYNPFVDFTVKLLTTLASVTGKERRPAVVEQLEEEGPANIVVRLPGRDEPLFEIFAVKNPKKVWESIVGMGELMADEEGVKSVKDLLRLLEED